jgi:hypothetical protein
MIKRPGTKLQIRQLQIRRQIPRPHDLSAGDDTTGIGTVIAFMIPLRRPSSGKRWATMTAIQWLNDLPLWQTAFFVVGGSIFFSSIGTIVARAYFGERQLEFNNILGGFKYLAMSQVYGAFVGFLLLGTYQRYDTVRTDMVVEANALTTLDRLASGFPKNARDQFRGALRDYAREVVDVEWPRMGRHNADLGTAAALDTLYDVFSSIETTSNNLHVFQGLQTENTKQTEMINYARQLVDVIRDMRGVRVLRSFGSMQVLLWVAVITGTVVAMIFPWLFGSPNPAAAFAMSVLSIVLMTSIIIVILKLSYPFGGPEGLQPTPYLAFLDEASSGR